MAPTAVETPTASTMSTSPLPTIDPEFIDKLDPDFIEYYNKNIAVKPATHNLTITDIRANSQKYASVWCKDFSGEDFVNDITIKSEDGHTFTARCYQPDPSTSPFGEGPYPAYINFHGGGWTFGDLTGDAEICLEIRTRLGIMVIDVDYRLCPEHVFGKGLDDGWAAIQYVYNNGENINVLSNSISIGGISAGGAMSASLAQIARDAGIQLKLAILAVPATIYHGDIAQPTDSPFASMVENKNAPCLSWSRLNFFRHKYMPKNDTEREVLFARPICHRSPMDGKLEGLCDTFIGTASCDPLRDEGEVYGQKLIEAGVKVTVRRYTGVPHPFMHMVPIKKAVMYLDDICAELKRVHLS